MNEQGEPTHFAWNADDGFIDGLSQLRLNSDYVCVDWKLAFSTFGTIRGSLKSLLWKQI